MSQYEEEVTKERQVKLIEFLQKKGIKYIYSPDDFHQNKYWITANTIHMEYIMSLYKNELIECNYRMLIEVNSLIKYASSDYKSIINYFRENVEEYTNSTYKRICIYYLFDK
jgi:hypothetical protein